MERETGYALIRDNFSEVEAASVTHHPLVVRSDPHHLLISKKSPGTKNLLDTFNQGLANIRNSGKLQLIIDTRTAVDKKTWRYEAKNK
jgi:polar amino acid transport system substrate-binding protein